MHEQVLKMGHYESSGMSWEEGEIPKCEYCGNEAVWETGTSGVVICDKDKCLCNYVRDNSDEIEYVEDDE